MMALSTKPKPTKGSDATTPTFNSCRTVGGPSAASAVPAASAAASDVRFPVHRTCQEAVSGRDAEAGGRDTGY